MPCKPCQVGASSLCMIVYNKFLWHGDAQACTQELTSHTDCTRTLETLPSYMSCMIAGCRVSHALIRMNLLNVVLCCR